MGMICPSCIVNQLTNHRWNKASMMDITDYAYIFIQLHISSLLINYSVVMHIMLLTFVVCWDNKQLKSRAFTIYADLCYAT